MYLPLFPLSVVVFPLEEINLHIFEPRYIQLVEECYAEDASFGIPPHIDDRLPGYGTEMIVTEIVVRHADGTMDIRCVGGLIFGILDFKNPAPGKLYAHGAIEYYAAPEIRPAVDDKLLLAVQELYLLLNQPLKYDLQQQQCFSYQIGHGIGLSLEEEYHLLTLETETERQHYLLEHLLRVIPVARNLERTKARIRMNGDFRTFGKLDF